MRWYACASSLSAPLLRSRAPRPVRQEVGTALVLHDVIEPAGLAPERRTAVLETDTARETQARLRGSLMQQMGGLETGACAGRAAGTPPTVGADVEPSQRAAHRSVRVEDLGSIASLPVDHADSGATGAPGGQSAAHDGTTAARERAHTGTGARISASVRARLRRSMHAGSFLRPEVYLEERRRLEVRALAR